MKISGRTSFIVLILLAMVSPLTAGDRGAALTAASIAHNAQKLRAPFMPNEGQVDERVAFHANTFGGSVFVTREGRIVYSLPDSRNADSGNTQHGLRNEPAIKGIAIQEELVGGMIGAIQGEERAITNVTYFKGKDPSSWKGNVPTYGVVNLGEVYRGIEFKLKAYGNNVEKLFSVKPAGDPDAIKIQLSGIRDLWINRQGQLEAKTDLGNVTFTKPVAYQEIGGTRTEVAVEYEVAEVKANCPSGRSNGIPDVQGRQFEYGFKVASYDKTKDLIIDPLLASTYLGGLNSDYGYAITLDSNGNVYATGYIESSDFPITPGAYDISYKGRDIFVSKLSGDLTKLLASTYLGGKYDDYARSIAVDSKRNVVYIVGQTSSSDFPTTEEAYDTTKDGYSDAFVTKLSGDLTTLLASTFLGGTSDDNACSIAIDQTGVNLYVSGSTASPDFPATSGAYDTTCNNGDVFVAKFSWNLKQITAATVLGGKSHDYGNAIVIGPDKNIYVAGDTWSFDFPANVNSYDNSFNGGFGDCFVSKFNGDLTHLLAATFLGGATDDSAHAMVLDSRGNVYLTGQTESPDFPITDGAYEVHFRNGDAFVSKLSGDLSALLASTYLGGADDDVGNSIALSSGGYVYVAGHTGSSEFPTTPGAFCVTKKVLFDGFISKLSGDLSRLYASTVLGGSYRDVIRAVTLDSGGNVYVIGETMSPDFPVMPDAYDATYNGDMRVSYAYDAFISKLDGNLSSALAISSKSESKTNHQ